MLATFACLQAFADERRNDVRGSRVEVIARPVQVHRQQADGVKSILLAVGLGLHQQHLLCQSVGGVGLFGVSVPQVFLAEGHRRELGISAHRTERYELADPALPGLVHEFNTHYQVVVKEFGRVLAVGPNPPYLGSKVDDQQVGWGEIRKRLGGETGWQQVRRAVLG